MKTKKKQTNKVKKAVKPKAKKVAVPKKKALKKNAVSPAKSKKNAKAVAKKHLTKKPAKPVKKAVKPAKKAKPEKKLVQPVKTPKPSKPKKQSAKKAITPVVIPQPPPDKLISDSGKIRVQFEYFTRSSVGVLYNAFSTASGLASWFADYVDSQENLFVFFWDGSEEKALLLETVEDEYTRFRWLEQPEDCFFEFRIRIDGITNEAALVITDYVEKGDEKEAKLLWDAQVHKLMHTLGS